MRNSHKTKFNIDILLIYIMSIIILTSIILAIIGLVLDYNKINKQYTEEETTTIEETLAEIDYNWSGHGSYTADQMSRFEEFESLVAETTTEEAIEETTEEETTVAEIVEQPTIIETQPAPVVPETQPVVQVPVLNEFMPYQALCCIPGFGTRWFTPDELDAAMGYPIGTTVNWQQYLFAQLTAKGIAWWYPYALAQAKQESGWNLYAVSRDGYDHGLFQFRLKYWQKRHPGLDIYSWKNQIDEYTDKFAIWVSPVGYSITVALGCHWFNEAIAIATPEGWVDNVNDPRYSKLVSYRNMIESRLANELMPMN